jgi:hypothetical protein
MIGEMSELAIARYDITECKYVSYIRPTIGVRDDTSFI